MCDGTPSRLFVPVKYDDGHTIAISSTVKCDGVTMYHLSLGICVMDIKKISSNKTKIRL